MLRNEDTIEAIPRITPQWLAGFFDGEGSVSAELAYDKYATVAITLTQKDPKILALIMLKYNAGNFKPYEGANGALCNRFRIRGKVAEQFLRDILPFVIVKRRQVEKAIEMLNIIGKSGDGNLRKRRELHDEIQILNREGNVSG